MIVRENVALSDAAHAAYSAKARLEDGVVLGRASARIRQMRPTRFERGVPVEWTEIGEEEEVWNLITNAGRDYLHLQGSETVTNSEAVVARRAARVTLAESTGLVEESLSSATRAIGLSENVTLAEAVAVVKRTAAALSETVALSESLLAAKHARAALSETVASAEALAAHLATVAVLSEAVSLGESLASRFTGVTELDESVALAESMQTIRRAHPQLAEVMIVADSIIASSGTQHHSVALAETVPIAETIGVRHREANPPLLTIETSAGLRVESEETGITVTPALQIEVL